MAKALGGSICPQLVDGTQRLWGMSQTLTRKRCWHGDEVHHELAQRKTKRTSCWHGDGDHRERVTAAGFDFGPTILSQLDTHVSEKQDALFIPEAEPDVSK